MTPRYNSLQPFGSENQLFTQHIEESSFRRFAEEQNSVNYPSEPCSRDIENVQIMIGKIDSINRYSSKTQIILSKSQKRWRQFYNGRKDRQFKEEIRGERQKMDKLS
jgi:hypothetical protein